MIKEQGQSIQNVSESMDIGPTAIRLWRGRVGGLFIGETQSRDQFVHVVVCKG
ncbi:hypothetical protein [Massilia sp. CCM 8734]|uniref:hypothetical protein n=1 Tax=Massilia sp. CCM 8734 TaxID=2609283 RepID=UPI0034D35F81